MAESIPWTRSACALGESVHQFKSILTKGFFFFGIDWSCRVDSNKVLDFATGDVI